MWHAVAVTVVALLSHSVTSSLSEAHEVLVLNVETGCAAHSSAAMIVQLITPNDTPLSGLSDGSPARLRALAGAESSEAEGEQLRGLYPTLHPWTTDLFYLFVVVGYLVLPVMCASASAFPVHSSRC